MICHVCVTSTCLVNFRTAVSFGKWIMHFKEKQTTKQNKQQTKIHRGMHVHVPTLDVLLQQGIILPAIF